MGPDAGAGQARPPIAGEAFLRALAAHGVDFFFANPGTDFPPIVEAYARAGNARLPRPVLVPHENLAVAMAHGAFLMTGRPQAVMVHVNVGTANTINNLANLSRERVPLLLAAGRTPITERGSFGSRSRPIHWAQEMFDQAGMVRELVKWDYELRMPAQAADMVARACEVAMTPPRGPVYLVLPREPLAAEVRDAPPASGPRPPAAAPHPDPAATATLAQWIAEAERPLIVAAAAGSEARNVELLARLAERAAIPVVSHGARVVNLPASHAMHFGYDSGPYLADADLVIVIESDAPWYPGRQEPPPGCRVAHVGEDPAFVRYPMRSFRSDLAIIAGAGAALAALDAALAGRLDAARVAARRARLASQNAARRARIVAPESSRITPQALSRAVGEAVGEDAIIFNEYPLLLDHCPRERPGTYFGLSPAGGLGWGLGAALGAKLAAPERRVVATIGDGAYLFTNPAACHWVAEAHGLPVLAIVFNNSRYGAVRRATLAMFRDGAAGADDGRFLADLDPSPPYDAMARAQGAHAERVERPDELADALARARAAVDGGRQALVNVICPY
ncbi:MAG: thiamine pyrophosphate-requiring protein [Xanthobacteraceae bacterium]|nr:thiamine pyrophosphate-requiring protein [Xanthobacteraceae bacterium]